MSAEHQDFKPSGDEIELVEQSPFLRWLDNFWYHYKWTVIISAFFALVLIVCVVQMFADPVYDINIGYSGTYGFSATEAEMMYNDLSAALPNDLNGDGARYAGFIRYQIYSEEEIKEEWKQVEQAREEAKAKGEDPAEITSKINLAFNTEQYSQFTNSLLTGQCYIYLCSPFVYDTVKSSGRVCRLADLGGNVPSYAYDECAVLLKDTPMYQNSEILQKLPEDTLVCLLTEIPQLFSQSGENTHKDAVSTFLGIIQ
jgi:hypothetical protein